MRYKAHVSEKTAWPIPPTLTISSIGVIHTKMVTKFDAPHQPKDGDDERNVIELNEGHNFESAVQDLDGFDRIWLVWWFHRNTTWRPYVLPPRGPAKRRGVFSTRSPHRPNPIGISVVPLLGVEGRKIYVGNTDLLDGTPILDIKPYISTVDSFPESSLGWIAEVEAAMAEPPRFTVQYCDRAAAQIAWLKSNWSVDFTGRVNEILSRDPGVHRTRRIRRWDDRFRQIHCGPWRVIFSVEELVVTIRFVLAGYPDRILFSRKTDWVPDQDAQIAFKEFWGESDREG